MAGGSLVGFIKGKSYNRCVRIHDLLASVMEEKMYRAFLKTCDDEELDPISEMLSGLPESGKDLENALINDSMFASHMKAHENYFIRVMTGEMGKTAQYWSIYVYLINRVHRNLMNAVHMNDLERYIRVITSVIPVFFALNRPKYVRWGTLHYDRLLNVSPKCKEVLESGAFTIKRTDNIFFKICCGYHVRANCE